MKDQAEHYYNEGFYFLKKRSLYESLASYDKALAIRPDYADRGITVDGYSLSSDGMSKQLPGMTKGLPSTWITQVRG
jgi:hypothetical protein